MKRITIRQFINGLAFLMVIGVSFIANVIPLNGHTTGEISGAFPTLTTPAPYTFLIWGMIYTALGCFIFYLTRVDADAEALLERIGPWFVVSCVANVAWIFFWHYHEFTWTIAAISVLLLSLIVIYTRLQIGLWDTTSRERLLITAPFSLYLGWITVATVANVSVTLNYADAFNSIGFNGPLWAAILSIIITKVTLIIVITRNDFIYAAVILWGLAGILINHDTTTWLANVIAACIVAILTLSCIKLANVLMWDKSTSILSIVERDK